MTIGIPAPRRSIRILGIETAYYRIQPATPPPRPRPAVVLLHGGAPGASSDLNWFRNTEALTGAGYELIAYDQPGFGHSGIPADHGIEFRYRHAVAFLQAMAPEAVHLVGNSIGGLLCCLIALRSAPGPAVRSLALAAPYPFFDIPVDAAARLAAHRSRLAGIEPTFDSIRRLCLNTFHEARQVTDDIVALRLASLQGERWDACQARAAVSRQFDQDAVRHAVVHLPSLLVWGLDDNSLPHEIGLAARRHFSDARILLLPRCGHWPQTEQWEIFNHNLLGFLEMNPPAPEGGPEAGRDGAPQAGTGAHR
ncbi:alpha/beta fold hydrolase [Xylophilus sp.]|uniref:alpha/beta fold hydrolase n=1 Tax=Xylophilus sp. TaxID=2653893 RepID=UPI0013BE1D25|nr:alpha/beta hydrolase [Xylophilus sp.]KAF1043042.1 MAG: 4,5:9,10-diseco-3-hydroxy-5,9,17-trioxoandrosta-1(10),2-diene-4-oate hydrolase [Xylophilus sp.]